MSTYDTLLFNQEEMLIKLARLEESVRARKEEKFVIGDWKTCPKLQFLTPSHRV